VRVDFYPYHVEGDDIFKRNLASLMPSHEVFVNTFRGRTCWQT
jgi:hypothetical protein